MINVPEIHVPSAVCNLDLRHFGTRNGFLGKVVDFLVVYWASFVVSCGKFRKFTLTPRTVGCFVSETLSITYLSGGVIVKRSLDTLCKALSSFFVPCEAERRSPFPVQMFVENISYCDGKHFCWWHLRP